MTEVSPPGWEGTVQGMKAHPEITNPFALAWYMSDKGDAPHEADLPAAWGKFKNDPAFLTYSEKYKANEANSASSLGQLTRPLQPKESKAVELTFGVRFLESEGGPNDAAREVPVIIIKEGMGNQADRHFYSADLLKRIAPLFNGVKAYADHPTKTQETDQPERSIRQVVGYYQNPRVVALEGKTAIAATLKIIEGQAYEWAWNLVKEAAAFAKKFKDKDLVGISINAWGASHQVEADDGIINMVDDLTEVQSADIVTQAGAGGGFRLREAVKKALNREGTKGGLPMNELLQKHGAALAAMRDQVKKDPVHEKAYGPAMDEMIAHHSEMMKGCESVPPASGAPAAGAGADSIGDDGIDEKKKEAARKAAGIETFEQMQERYTAGKMSATEKRIFEMLCSDRAERKVRENVDMVARTIKEAGIPAAYSDDLPILCAGKTEAEVKRVVEARKTIIAPLLQNRGAGAGEGAGGGKTPSKLQEKMAGLGVLKAVK